jgi:hypothetical protein
MVEFVRERDYVDGENLPRALQAAFGTFWALRRREINWSLRQEEIQVALQVLCDAKGGSPSFAYNTIMLIQPDLRQRERWEADDRGSRAVRRACDLTVMAEVAHRCERYRQAVIWSEVALGELIAASPGGDEASLLKAVASAKRSQLAAATTAVIGIWPASIRRALLPPQVKEQHYRRIDRFISALLASGQTYSRSHAFGTQSGFLTAERFHRAGSSKDELMSALAELREVSVQTRGKSKRGLATAPLVEMEYLRALGELEGAERQAALARERLIEFGLPRHLDRMTKYRYLSPPSPP